MDKEKTRKEIKKWIVTLVIIIIGIKLLVFIMEVMTLGPLQSSIGLGLNTFISSLKGIEGAVFLGLLVILVILVISYFLVGGERQRKEEEEHAPAYV
jgi:uncharacterized protein YpmB